MAVDQQLFCRHSSVFRKIEFNLELLPATKYILVFSGPHCSIKLAYLLTPVKAQLISIKNPSFSYTDAKRGKKLSIIIVLRSTPLRDVPIYSAGDSAIGGTCHLGTLYNLSLFDTSLFPHGSSAIFFYALTKINVNRMLFCSYKNALK